MVWDRTDNTLEYHVEHPANLTYELQLVNRERAKVGAMRFRIADDLQYETDIRARELAQFFRIHVQMEVPALLFSIDWRKILLWGSDTEYGTYWVQLLHL